MADVERSAAESEVAASDVAASARGPAFASRLAIVASIFGAFGLLVTSGAPLCPFAALTDHPCPGCGLTRSSLAILRGDLHVALALQPFAFLMTPLLSVALCMVVFNYLSSGRAIFSQRFARFFLPTFGLLFLAMFGFWVARFFGVHGGPVPV